MIVSFVILTHNRRAALLGTLSRVTEACRRDGINAEWIVVDNGSTDGSAAAVDLEFPDVRVIRRLRNEGVSARNHGLAVARGRYAVLIDDDSYPLGNAVADSIHYLDEHLGCGAVSGRVVLADGRAEASAMPAVIINSGVCLRMSAVREVGGFPREFFRQAEEYDLSFRLWRAGYTVERFEDVVYGHDKVAGNRAPALVHRMDMRNNLILVERYLPEPIRAIYREDWSRRYTALARHAGHGGAALRGLWEARAWAWRERCVGRRTLSHLTVESIFGWEAQAAAVAAWSRRHGVRRVVIADLSKNLYATHRACREAGLEILGIADNHPAYTGMAYRGAAVGRDEHTIDGRAQGVVLSNVNPAQVDTRLASLAGRFKGPLLRLWTPTWLHPSAAPGMPGIPGIPSVAGVAEITTNQAA